MNAAYALNIPLDRFEAACEAYANMKVEEKRWRGMRGFFNALGKNPALIVVAVVNVVASVVTSGGWAPVLTATLAFVAGSENARRMLSLNSYANSISSLRYTPSLLSSARRQAKNRKSLNPHIFHAYANYPQGAVYESFKTGVSLGGVERQDLLFGKAHFAGRGILRKEVESEKIALNDQTQNRKETTAAV